MSPSVAKKNHCHEIKSKQESSLNSSKFKVKWGHGGINLAHQWCIPFVTIKAILLTFHFLWILVAAQDTNIIRRSGPQNVLHTTNVSRTRMYEANNLMSTFVSTQRRNQSRTLCTPPRVAAHYALVLTQQSSLSHRERTTLCSWHC